MTDKEKLVFSSKSQTHITLAELGDMLILDITDMLYIYVDDDYKK